jgi:uncharacterized protein involved in exopolysaccharide biosynthesis
MGRYLDTARGYRWVILVVLALTWCAGGVLAYTEYVTSFEASATIWAQRASRQFASISSLDPELTALLMPPMESAGALTSLVTTPATEQADVLKQLLQTRSFLREIVRRTSSPPPDADDTKLLDEIGKRYNVQVLGTNLFKLSYRASDPHTGARMVNAALEVRQDHQAAKRTEATDAVAAFYRSKLGVAEKEASDAQRDLDAFDETHRPPLSSSDDYQQRQLRLKVEETKARVTDVKLRIDRSSVLPSVLQMADSLDFQLVDMPLDVAKPSGGLRPAAMSAGSAIIAGLALVIALIVAGTLLGGRIAADADIRQLVPATVGSTAPPPVAVT